MDNPREDYSVPARVQVPNCAIFGCQHTVVFVNGLLDAQRCIEC